MLTGSGKQDKKKENEDSPPHNQQSLSDCHGLVRAHRLVDLKGCSHDLNIGKSRKVVQFGVDDVVILCARKLTVILTTKLSVILTVLYDGY